MTAITKLPAVLKTKKYPDGGLAAHILACGECQGEEWTVMELADYHVVFVECVNCGARYFESFEETPVDEIEIT